MTFIILFQKFFQPSLIINMVLITLSKEYSIWDVEPDFVEIKLKINIKDYNEIYKFLLTPKNYRNKIDQIDLNFTYNFDQKIAVLKDIKIDNKINQNINKILSNIIIKKDDLQNKIYFKNLLNEAIKSYAG